MEGKKIHPRAWTWLAAAALVILAALRFIDLDADPPLYYSHLSQSLLTDPYHLTFYARNAVLFDDWSPFDFHRFDVFRNSLISSIAYLFFGMFGVSAVTANLSALTANLLGLLFFLTGMRSARPPRETFFVGFLLLSSSHLFFYGRVPFLENGLILLSGLLFFIMMRYQDRVWGQFVVGLLVALATFAGKLFGVILLGPVVLSFLYLYRRRAVIPIAYTFGGFIVGAAAYLLIFYGGDVTLLRSYYLEQSVGLYGAPPALGSLDALVRYLVTYGKEAGLWRFAPYFVALAGLGFIFFIAHVDIRKPTRDDLPALFSALWVMCGVLSLMLFSYRPLRYSLFLFLPAAALAGIAVERAIRGDWSFNIRYRWFTPILAGGTIWYLLTQTALLFVNDWRAAVFGGYLKWLTLAVSAVVTYACYLFLTRYRGSAQKVIVLAPIAVLFLAVTLQQFDLIKSGLTQRGKALQQYSHEMVALIHPDAVLTGPYMPALTIENNLRGLIYNFALANTDPGFFSKYPVSHVLTDAPAWRSAVREFPQLNAAILISQLAVREHIVELYRLPTAKVPLTEFELGTLALRNNDWETALPHFRKFAGEHSHSLLGNLQLAMSLYAGERYQECINRLEKVDREFPDDYMAHEFAREFYTRIYRRTQIADYQIKADYHAFKVRQLNPYAPTTGSE